MSRLVLGLVLISSTFIFLPTESGAATDEPAVHFVIDVSGSMRGTKLSRAVEALKGAVQAIPDTTAVGLRSYAGSCNQTGVAPIVPIATANDSAMIAAADQLRAGGGTPTTAALAEALKDVRSFGSTGPSRIVLLTDGDTQCGVAVCDFVQSSFPIGTDFTLYTVGLQVSSSSAADLTCAAEATGGQYIPAENPDDLIEALTNATGGTSNDPRNVPDGVSLNTPWWEFPDTDDDGIPDKWETDGVYVNGSLNDLRAQGARVGQIDAFVYIDVVEGERWNSRIEAQLAQAFSASPLSVRLHIVGRDGFLARNDIPPGISAGRFFFERATSASTSTGASFARSGWEQSNSTPQLAKYACVCPDHILGSGVGGQAIDILGDYLVLTMNEAEWATDIQREADNRAVLSGSMLQLAYDRLNTITLMHELGHLYGLRHHGATDSPAFDPQYESIMSYSYNAFGVPRTSGVGTAYSIDYSRTATVNLDWRTSSAQQKFGALTFVHGQNGERPGFYSTASSFNGPEVSPVEEATLDELLQNDFVGSQAYSYLEALGIEAEDLDYLVRFYLDDDMNSQGLIRSFASKIEAGEFGAFQNHVESMCCAPARGKRFSEHEAATLLDDLERILSS